MNRVVVVGGGPGGYEAALVAAQLGADVTVVDTDGLGGSAVLTDCVPSKTLIATAELMADMEEANELGIRFEGSLVDRPRHRQRPGDAARAGAVRRHRAPADPRGRAGRCGPAARLDGPRAGRRHPGRRGPEETLEADAVLLATGAAPRTLDSAQPDGERILTWEQVYELDEVPEHLIVVGSGVTGAEFASAYNALGVDVTLVSSRDRVLPGEDADAAGGARGRLHPPRHDRAVEVPDAVGVPATGTR